MTSIDDIIKNLSKQSFSQLHPRIKRNETGELRILKILAEKGQLNQKEIAKLTSGSYPYFDRWGVKSRLDGGGNFLGLIPCEFVQSVKKNEKETKYELTFKGLLAILSEKKLEDIDLFKRYKKFLRHLNNDPKILRWSVDFIKTEIALILAHNAIQGIDWSKFKYVKNYWGDFKVYDDRVVQKFFIDKIFRSNEEYVSLQRDYLKLFFILDKVVDTLHCTFNSEWYAGIEINNTLRLCVDRWYLFIDKYKYGRYPIRDGWEYIDEHTFFDEEYWHKRCHRPMIDADRILRNEGYLK